MLLRRSFSLTVAILMFGYAGWAANGSILYNFNPRQGDGGSPVAGLTADHDGNLYGTTYSGGSSTACPNGCGTVFELTRNTDATWAETVLYSFSGSADGSRPMAGLTFDASGNIYGTTATGGDSFCQCGAVFELTPSNGTWAETTLHDFLGQGNDGASPRSRLVMGPAGHLYGTTLQGGTSNEGSAFELMPSGGNWVYRMIYSFLGNPNGLVLNAGILYGTKQGGGVYGGGTAFKLAQSSGVWTETTLYDFTGGNNGFAPFASLTFDAAGNAYGTTRDGGIDTVGTVFKLTPSTNRARWLVTVLYSFTGGLDGAYPEAGVTIDPTGNLYGTTLFGGSYELGTVFELTPSNGEWTINTLHSFTLGIKDGRYPQAGLTLVSGALYGTASGGGTDGGGVVFRIHP